VGGCRAYLGIISNYSWRRIMTKFFFELTKRNWGAPYHILIWGWLSHALMMLYEGLFRITDFESLFRATLISIGLSMLIGTLYEMYQNIGGKQERREVLEDLGCDLFGAILGVLFFVIRWILIG
jgi:hypothetical protein